MTAGRLASGILDFSKKYNETEFTKVSLYRVVMQNVEMFGADDVEIIHVLKALKNHRDNSYLNIIDGTIQEMINEEQTFLILSQMVEGV